MATGRWAKPNDEAVPSQIADTGFDTHPLKPFRFENLIKTLRHTARYPSLSDFGNEVFHNAAASGIDRGLFAFARTYQYSSSATSVSVR